MKNYQELLKKHQVCYIEDSYLASIYEGHSRFVVNLNSGFTVWQDDDRPDVEPKSAWLRLRNYCMESGDYITNFTIQFRSHRESLPSNALGYYFVKSILASFHSTENHYFFVAGTTLSETENSTIVRVQSYKIPEVISIEEEDRIVDKNDICLIRKS